MRLAAETDLTFLFVTHNLAQARRIGDHGLLLVGGRVVDQRTLAGLSRRPGRRDVTRRFVEGRLPGDTDGSPAEAANSQADAAGAAGDVTDGLSAAASREPDPPRAAAP